MQGAAPLPPVERRRFGLGLLAALLVLPVLAACKDDVQPGSGLQTIRRQKELQPGGR